jgi:hypothetical protein
MRSLGLGLGGVDMQKTDWPVDLYGTCRCLLTFPPARVGLRDAAMLSTLSPAHHSLVFRIAGSSEQHRLDSD